MTLNWKARRLGDKYCAPACGRGCTHAEYKKAKASASALVQKLGPGWTAHVFENLGWHYKATRGQIEVHRSAGFGYIAFFNARIQTIGESKSPRRAVKNAIDEMEGHVQELIKSIAASSETPK